MRTKKRQLPWGPALTSASGAPAPPSLVNAHEQVPRTLVRLPSGMHGTVDVAVDGVPQVEGEDYFLVGRLLVFERRLVRESRARHWRRVLASWGMGASRRHERVDVWWHSDAGASAMRNLDVETYPAP
jgi:hypothetical protein